MSNHGNYAISLGNLCRWLAVQAENLGVEIYPGFAASDILYDEEGVVKGVITGDMGVGKDGKPLERFMRDGIKEIYIFCRRSARKPVKTNY